MDRRGFIVRAAAIATAAALPFQRVAQPAEDLAARVAAECETIGYRVTAAPPGGPAAFNLWAKLSETEEVMAGWVMRSGLTHFIDPVWLGPR